MVQTAFRYLDYFDKRNWYLLEIQSHRMAERGLWEVF